MTAPIIVGLDFETRSACNLPQEGAYRYATDLTTQAICCCYLVDDVVKSWWPDWVADILGELPKDMAPDRIDCDYFQAWNSQFDRLIWQCVAANDYGWEQTSIAEWLCSASLARSNGLPGALDDAAKALGLNVRKDARGKELIKLLSIPNGGTREAPTFNEEPKLIREMVEYCEQDVRVEAAMAKCMRSFLPHEVHEFHVSEKINDRGVCFDLAFARKAVTFSEREMAVLTTQLTAATNYAVEKPTQSMRIKKWLMHNYQALETDADDAGDRYTAIPGAVTRITPQALTLMTVYKKGARKLSLDKSVRTNLIEAYAEDPDIMTEAAADVVNLTDLAGRSSTAKYKKMVSREIDGRLLGSYMFAGAKSTGRFSSHGIQVHNMVRDCVEDFDVALASLDSDDDIKVMKTLAEMMRPTFKAEAGKLLYFSDWSNIEGRVLPWLANTASSERKLDMFRHQDAHPDEPDVYERMATEMGLKDRQTGKVAELSLGYGGGVGAFQAMARNYGVRVDDSVAKAVQKKWRGINEWAQPFWYGLKDAAWGAMTTPNKVFKHGRVAYFHTLHTHNGLGTLWCQLPSRRLLSYVAPKFERVPCPWDENESMVELTCIKASFKPAAGETDWPRHKLWYGVLAENATQAVAADILRDALVAFDDEKLDVVLHTHDDIVVESDRDVGNLVQDIMHTNPSWAEDLPLSADIHSGLRYTK